MKFSKNWLLEWINKPLDNNTLLQQLAMAGHEIEQVEAVAGEFTGVIVAEVLETMQHPNADRLKLCKVNTGSETLDIVCGGKNVRAGLKVPLALVGAKLPNNLNIRKGKIRGEESMGMICSEVELGLAETSEGIMELPSSAPIGQDIREYLQLNDISIDVALTPNRGDCLSIMGLAREIAAINAYSVINHPTQTIAPSIKDGFPISISAEEACPRYVGRVIRNINPKAQTPIWMHEKLRRSGLRSISPVVDVTNYVLLELGQPLHAFDLENLNFGIEVRFAHKNEELILLNGDKINLDTDTLVIADKKGPLAIAGVMGGQTSGCSETTQHIFLESAFFTPAAIAGRARKYGLHTDSSHRFERGVDPELQVTAIERATQLLLEIVGGEAGPVLHQFNKNYIPVQRNIELAENKAKKILGLSLKSQQIVDILTRLHMEVATTSNGWQATIPSYRFDLNLDVDLIEEIARLYGYNQIPMNLPQSSIKELAAKETQISVEQIRQKLVDLGYQEAYTYSFVAPKLQQKLEPNLNPLILTNPISADMSVMRTSLWTGLLQAVIYNQSRQQQRLRLFEIGQCFVQNSKGELEQKDRIAGIVTDLAFPEQWSIPARSVDFFDIKGDVAALLELTGKKVDFMITKVDSTDFDQNNKIYETSMLHPGQAAVLRHKKTGLDRLSDHVVPSEARNLLIGRNGGQGQKTEWETIGRLGALHPDIQQQLKLDTAIFMFEIEFEALTEAVLSNFKPISKFPSIRRDLALLLNRTVPAYDLETVIAEAGGELVTAINIFDVYLGKGIPEDKKSVAVALTIAHQERTLVDEEVNELMAKIIEALEKQLSATLRV